MIEPRKLIAGDSVSWNRTLSGYLPSDGWTLSYRLVSLNNSYEISSSGNGNEHRVALTGTDTENWVEGEYSLVAWVSKGDDRHTISQARVRVMPNPASANYDPRSFNEKVLAELEKLLQGKASKDRQTVTVDGQTIGRYTWPELMQAEKFYRGRVNRHRRRQREKRTGRTSNRVLVRIR
ncbi:hypothetical protein [uncultured Microbulbifer sp.]|uniref:hypothetical protein n=1 Tax=uncultured Microbulbifer sp. TaxID=348147 RepID=UPI0026265EE9|nr:hypothetical protein [uncultured Microbulbifer sp.]